MAQPYREFHGIRVPDPFRWLEDADSPAVRDWVAEQEVRTDAYLRGCSELPRCREFLERNHPALAPDWSAARGAREFALVRRAGAAQPLLVVREGGVERVLVDPNPAGRVLPADPPSVSPDGAYVAYTTTPTSGIPSTLHVCDVGAGRTTETSRCVTALPMYAWHPNGRGYFYSLFRGLFDDDGSGDARRDGLYWHALGGDFASDPCIHPYHGKAAHMAFAIVAGEHLLVCNLHFSSGKSGASVCRLADVDLTGATPPPLVELFPELQTYNQFLGTASGELYFHTCRDAPMGRIVAIDPTRPQPADWRTVVAGTELALGRPERFGGPLKSALGAGGLLVSYVRDARNVLRAFDLDGRAGIWLEPAVHSTVDAVEPAGSGFRIALQSFLHPRVICSWQPGEPALREVDKVALPDVDPARYALRQEFYASKDGTRVPMFLLHRHDLPHDGNQPALLYGYGGFNQAISPEFSPEIALWLELGGVYALANIRGGGEYGEAWHAAGSRANKQNTFDDFHAAAGHLIARGITRPAKLAARGLSNGGLLTAVAANQRPDLFAAVITEVPLVDMLWLDETQAGQSLGAEYGNPFESRAMFELLRAYSPVHNVRPGGPAQMVVVAEQDFSAPPGQACKLVAARQAVERDAPVLLRVVKGEGHTGWRPASTRGALAEEIAFLRRALGESPPLREPDLPDQRVRMRDGVALSTNIYLPRTTPAATVLLRTPYANDAAEFARLGLGAYVDAGYAVAIQSVRGRGASGGTFGFFFAEGLDGFDAIEWLAAQPWSDGRVAMDGGSYLGTVQWLAARERPPHLVAMMPAVAAGDWFNEIPYMGGALQVDWAFSWLGMLGGLAFEFDDTGERNLQKWRPLIDAERVLGAKLPWYREVLAHPPGDGFWQPIDFRAEDFSALTLPVLCVTGWFDGDQAGAMRYWHGLQEHSAAPSQLIVGPWEHRDCYLGGSGSIGEMAFGPQSVVPIARERLDFLRRHLDNRGAAPAPRVRVFIMGANAWREFDRYPPRQMRMQPWFLAADRALDPRAAHGEPDRYAYDPLDPVPYRAGARDHADLEARADVLTYTSPVLDAPLTICGAVELVLHAASSARDTDFTAKLLDVQPDGRALSLTHVGGVLRARYRHGFERAELLTPGEPAELRIRLSHVGHEFGAGHRVRLEVSSSCFPMIDPNTNTGGDFRTDVGTQLAKQTIFHDAQRPSRLLLPVLEE
jgi:putative CocE/NonD family hydrolase